MGEEQAVMGGEVLFWILAVTMVGAALGLLFARKAVHVAMAVVLVMVSLAILYIQLAAPFLGVVQIVVYTGAVMMLFLFVLMLVGVDQREDMKETLRGQRWIALLGGLGLAALLITAFSRVAVEFNDLRQNPSVTNPEAVANSIFGRYVVIMEVLGILLITAAVGALVLTHLPRLRARRTQLEVAEQRLLAKANPVNKMMPGVYARHNALDIPALDPEGKPIEESVSRVLKARNQSSDGKRWLASEKEDGE